MQKITWILTSISLFVILASCGNPTAKDLPILGRMDISGTDTLYHTIPDWSFTNQDNKIVTNESLSDNIYITDFFFTSCPSICPKVMKNMLYLHNELEQDDLVKFVSFTIDPKRDDPARLKRYSSNLGVGTPKWHFLTGDQDSLLDLADEYFIVALKDDDAPGGFDHSGKIILTDKDGHVRAFCEGTDPEDVKKFVPKVKQLIDTYQK